MLYRVQGGTVPHGFMVRWKERRDWGLQIFYCLFWCGLFAIIRLSEGEWSLRVILFGVVCGIMLYVFGRPLINRTMLMVERGSLEIRTGPLPPRRKQRLPSTAIRQLYVKHASPHPTMREGEAPYYEVWLITAMDGDQALVATDTRAQALWLAERIEHHLGIVDHIVPFEVDKEPEA
jgi:hypothetical protein